MKVKIEGINEAIKNLKILGDKMQRKAVASSLRDGTKLLKSAVQADAPVKSGATKAAVKVRAGKRKKGKVSMMVSIGEGWFKGATFYAAFDALGHMQGSRKNGDRKHIPGNRYLQNAMAQATEPVLEKIKESLAKFANEKAA